MLASCAVASRGGQPCMMAGWWCDTSVFFLFQTTSSNHDGRPIGAPHLLTWGVTSPVQLLLYPLVHLKLLCIHNSVHASGCQSWLMIWPHAFCVFPYFMKQEYEPHAFLFVCALVLTN